MVWTGSDGRCLLQAEEHRGERQQDDDDGAEALDDELHHDGAPLSGWT